MRRILTSRMCEKENISRDYWCSKSDISKGACIDILSSCGWILFTRYGNECTPRPCKAIWTVFDSGFQAGDSGFQVLDFSFHLSFSWIPDSKAKDFWFFKQKLPWFRSPDYLTSVGRERNPLIYLLRVKERLIQGWIISHSKSSSFSLADRHNWT